MAENVPETQDSVTREYLLESINELFGPEPGERTISGWLYSRDGWPDTGVYIQKIGTDITDVDITVRLRFLETDGTRIHHTVHLSSRPGETVKQFFDNPWGIAGKETGIPSQPPFEDFVDNPSVMLNHVILYTAYSYHEAVEMGYGSLWKLDDPFAN